MERQFIHIRDKHIRDVASHGAVIQVIPSSSLLIENTTIHGAGGMGLVIEQVTAPAAPKPNYGLAGMAKDIATSFLAAALAKGVTG